MNEAWKLDELEIQLYAIMPQVRSKDIDIYHAADSNQISTKSSRKILRNMKREIQYIESHKTYRPVVEVWKRAVVTVLIVMSVGFASFMTVEAARNAIRDTIIKWYEESIFFQYNGGSDVDVPDTLLEYREPVVGDEYDRYESARNASSYAIEYESDSVLISYQQSPLKDYEVLLSNYETTVHTADINGHEGKAASYVIHGVEYHTIIWNDGRYAYKLNSNLSFPDLILIANTVS